jgi:hypothetical protein
MLSPEQQDALATTFSSFQLQPHQWAATAREISSLPADQIAAIPGLAPQLLGERLNEILQRVSAAPAVPGATTGRLQGDQLQQPRPASDFNTPLQLLQSLGRAIQDDPGMAKYNDFLSTNKTKLKALLEEHITKKVPAAEAKPFIVYNVLQSNVERIVNVGDLHGNVQGLAKIMEVAKVGGYMDEDCKVTEGTRWVFTGDYVDSGKYGLFLSVAVAWFCNLNVGRVVVVNGNHEIDYDHDVELKTEVLQWCEKVYDEAPVSSVEAIQMSLLRRNVWPNVERWFKSQCPIAYFANFQGKWISYVHGFVDPTITLAFPSSGDYKQEIDDDGQVHGTLWHDVGTKESESSRTTLLFPDIQRWMEDNDVFAVIRGHQDTRNLQILVEGAANADRLKECVDEKGLFIASRDRKNKICAQSMMCDEQVKSDLVTKRNVPPQLTFELTGNWKRGHFQTDGETLRALRVFTFSSAEAKGVCASAAMGVLRARKIT